MHFFNVFCIFGFFLGGNLGFWGGKSPQEIAGNNTGHSDTSISRKSHLVTIRQPSISGNIETSFW